MQNVKSVVKFCFALAMMGMASFVRAESPAAQDAVVSTDQKALSFIVDGRSPKGARQWHLEGSSAEIINDEIHLEDMKAVAYGDDSEVNLSSDSGIYRKDEGEVELIGDVHVKSSDGAILTTEKAKWSQLTKDISTDTDVRVEGDGMVAKGDGAIANSDKKTASLIKDVEVRIEPFTVVKCDGPMEIEYDANKAVFYNNVSVEDKDGKLYSDMLTVFVDKDTKKLSTVVAEGNVKVEKGHSYMTSDKAIYMGSTRSAKLIGNPKVVIAPEEFGDLQKMSGVVGTQSSPKDTNSEVKS